eukprot:TRINITY_DN6056_c0_g1_i1.p2 TRINITY_DN6056_c0_g1~~TRINITY_DN6056_c0_g1_i1.p2  ORF type:complete len:176 (+),score=42.40 TRINITY_DN6056_c0_g1_i1:1480-2007(+)
MLIQELLRLSPEDRPSADDILRNYSQQPNFNYPFTSTSTMSSSSRSKSETSLCPVISPPLRKQFPTFQEKRRRGVHERKVPFALKYESPDNERGEKRDRHQGADRFNENQKFVEQLFRNGMEVKDEQIMLRDEMMTLREELKTLQNIQKDVNKRIEAIIKILNTAGQPNSNHFYD